MPGIAVSEASVERCFNIHKRMHSPFRASISPDVVDDVLFIRYNNPYKFKFDDDDEDEQSPITDFVPFDQE